MITATMMDTIALAQRAAAYQVLHRPNTGYTRGVFNLLDVMARNGQLKAGTNLMIQAALQYTGQEEATDQLHWNTNERRIPYSQSSRYSLDYKVDCSSWVWAFGKIFFKKDIGTYTEAQWYKIPKIGGYPVAWEDRRPTDLEQYLFPGSTHAHVSHDAMIGRPGKIVHTTSATNPMREETDTYAANRRVRTWRIWTEDEYQSLIVPEMPTDPIYQHAMWYSKPAFVGQDVKHYQAITKTLLEQIDRSDAKLAASLLQVNGTFGAMTRWALQIVQGELGLHKTGAIDRYTASMLDRQI